MACSRPQGRPAHGPRGGLLTAPGREGGQQQDGGSVEKASLTRPLLSATVCWLSHSPPPALPCPSRLSSRVLIILHDLSCLLIILSELSYLLIILPKLSSFVTLSPKPSYLIRHPDAHQISGEGGGSGGSRCKVDKREATDEKGNSKWKWGGRKKGRGSAVREFLCGKEEKVVVGEAGRRLGDTGWEMAGKVRLLCGRRCQSAPVGKLAVNYVNICSALNI